MSSSTKPSRWTSYHDEALIRHARNGEDAESTAILLAVEFEEELKGKGKGEGNGKEKVTREWVERRGRELGVLTGGAGR